MANDEMTPEKATAHQVPVTKARSYLSRLHAGEALVVRSILPEMGVQPTTLRARRDTFGLMWGYEALHEEQGRMVVVNDGVMLADSAMRSSLMLVEEGPGANPLQQGTGRKGAA